MSGSRACSGGYRFKIVADVAYMVKIDKCSRMQSIAKRRI